MKKELLNGATRQATLAASGNIILTVAALFIIIYGIKSAATIITPLLLATFITIICAPVINIMTRHRIPQWLAIFVLFALITSVFSLFIGLLGATVSEFTRSLPEYRILLTQKISQLLEFAHRFNLQDIFPRDKLTESLNPNFFINLVRNTFSSLSGTVTSIFVLFLIVLFMLSEMGIAQQKLANLFDGEEKKAEQVARVYKILDSVMQYLSVKTLTSFLTALSVYIMLKILGVQYAILWATCAFLFNFIPNIGSVLAAIPVIIQALILNGFSIGLIVTIGYIVINMLLGNFIEPKLMGKRLGLSTLVVFISLIFWGWLLGLTGMFLSVPLTMTTKIILEANPSTAKLAYLLGNGSE